MSNSLFYKQKPLFGLDIGLRTIKIAQVAESKDGVEVVGYGYTSFDPAAIVDGQVTKPELIVSALKSLLDQTVIGKISTNRIAVSIPTAQIFARAITLPKLSGEDLKTAIRMQAEQYVPLPPDQVYLDYVISKDADKNSDEVLALIVATPKKTVDSYMALFDQLNLEVETVEPNLSAIVRAVNYSLGNKKPKVIIDFGAESSDLAIYDQGLQLIGTVDMGGSHITKKIAETLGIDIHQAQKIKNRYGITASKWQGQLTSALSPILNSLATEVQKMLRYHHEHSKFDQPIEEVVIVGGGASLPGMSDFIAHLTGITVSACDPWSNIKVSPLQPPHKNEVSLYTTAVGLALREVASD
ncbi:MAG: type IV pilus assembly protein PilM [Candidatus Saccharimonadales bacterium]